VKRKWIIQWNGPEINPVEHHQDIIDLSYEYGNFEEK
jgi:hypothetical protein